VYKQYRCQSSLPRKDRRVSAWLRGIYLHLCIGSTHCPIADAHRNDGKRFIVRADEILTAFVELQRAIHELAVDLIS